MKKLLMVAAAAATLATGSLTATQASAHHFGGYWHGHGHGHFFGGWGGYGGYGGYGYEDCHWYPYPYPHMVCD